MDTTAHASPPAATGPLSLHGLSVEGVNQCVHCGLCLAYCPTFAELGTEMDSPRGRIFLIKSLAEGRMALSDSTVRHLSLCLDCRACETVCPAGVPYGRLIEAAKAEIERDRPSTLGRRIFLWSIANRVSYCLNLSGPSLTLDTACSSSLTALYLACEAIQAGNCSAAIVGGVNLDLHQARFDINHQGGALSPDGVCRSFGKGANGYVMGEGIGALYL